MPSSVHAEKLQTIRLASEEIPCFWCGVCCTYYQAYLELPEANALAAKLDMDWNKFVQEYTDPRWGSDKSVLLRRTVHGCPFLEQPDGSAFGLCRIHAFKPQCCRDWQAKLWKKECRRGLSQFWNLCVDENDHITGTPDDMLVFQTFLKTLTGQEV